jgi:hypothetical protein
LCHGGADAQKFQPTFPVDPSATLTPVTSCGMTVNMEGCEIDFKIILLDFGDFSDNGYICRVPEGVGQI